MRKIAAIGGGVIGGGWVARFLLNGFDVAVYDPAPGAEGAVARMIDNAARAYRRLTLAPLPERGTLTFAPTVAEAVAGALYVQESVPERLELKHRLLGEILAASDAPVGSSTSGFTPSALRQGLGDGGARVFVAHPFNPVYLLPLVEVVAGEGGDLGAVAAAEALFAEVGMKPLRIGKEIDAHIADRLLEAVWREGLWLVHDGVATTADIDDAIRYGFGLRWAQMGLFETYRIAGGEAGMRHFLAQFGPALKWPWTRLMDVPELTDALIDTIAAQSDAQSGMHTIAALERKRDDNLAGFLQVLKANDWGAGTVLKAYEDSLWAKAGAGARAARLVRGEPLRLLAGRVRPDWTDYNGHMTESRYLEVFGSATDAFLAFIGMDEAYRAGGASVFTVETHLRHLREGKAGAAYAVATRLLGYDAKRIRIVHEMTGEDGVLATGEHMLLSVRAGRSAPLGEALRERLAEVAAAQEGLSTPEWAGQAIRAVGA